MKPLALEGNRQPRTVVDEPPPKPPRRRTPGVVRWEPSAKTATRNWCNLRREPFLATPDRKWNGWGAAVDALRYEEIFRWAGGGAVCNSLIRSDIVGMRQILEYLRDDGNAPGGQNVCPTGILDYTNNFLLSQNHVEKFNIRKRRDKKIAENKILSFIV